MIDVLPRAPHLRVSRVGMCLTLVLGLGLGVTFYLNADRLVSAAAARSTRIALPATIDATGSRDVSTELNSFFVSVADGSTVVLPEDGVLRIEKPVVLKNKNGLVIEGNGATTVTTTRGDRTRHHWRLLNGSDVVIRDLTVKGANPAGGTGERAYVASLEAQHGFDVAGTNGLELDHVTVTDVYGDFVYLGMNTVTRVWSKNVRIHNSYFARNGRQGIALTGAKYVRIDHNVIENTRRATFDLEPNGRDWGVTDVSIDHNRIGAGRLNFLSAVGSGAVNNVTVDSNQLVGRAMNSAVGTANERRSNWRWTNNVADAGYGNPDGAAMYFKNIDGLVVSGNTQRMQAKRNMYGVSSNGSCGLVVRGNTFQQAAGQLRVSAACPMKSSSTGNTRAG